MTPIEQSTYGSRPNSRAQSVKGFDGPRPESRRQKPVNEHEIQKILDNIRVQLLKKGLFSIIQFGKNLKVRTI